jgi:hypothetical protein
VCSRDQSFRFAEGHRAVGSRRDAITERAQIQRLDVQRIGIIINDKGVPLAYRHPDKSVRDTQLQDECQMDEYCGQ